jgi:hypothetical protein
LMKKMRVRATKNKSFLWSAALNEFSRCRQRPFRDSKSSLLS